MSLMMVSSELAEYMALLTSSFDFSSNSERSRICKVPNTPFMGVLIS